MSADKAERSKTSSCGTGDLARGRQRRRRSFLGASVRWTWRAYARLARVLMTAIFGTLLLCFGVLFVNYVVLSTADSRAYRNLDPSVPECRDGADKGWSALADIGRGRLGMTMEADDGGWADATNDEIALVESDARWNTRLRCSLQHHVVPSVSPGGKPLDYHLGFLEFQESGEPYALVSKRAEDDTEAAITSDMLRSAMQAEKQDGSAEPVISQLDALKKHLSTGSNYVIAFVHGWRHDARIGDGNVADLRLYAAHAARFLQERCQSDPKYCGVKVTAIYIGWRGARVDERGLRNAFGDALGGFVGKVSAGATLFDRKPVSEAIAPAVISALQTVESVLAPTSANGAAEPNAFNKMVVAGHSLGGNVLATGLRDELVKSVRRHKFGETLPPVLGNLVILLNPAAEASKWTAIQREIWSRLAEHADRNTPLSEVVRDNGFFPASQPPVMISVTAARSFPAGGLRPGDCAWIGLDIDDADKDARERIRERLKKTDSMFDSGVDYDWATHDLFPAFKFDYHPLADYLDRLAARIEGHAPPGTTCTSSKPVGFFTRLTTLPLRALSTVASTFPFQVSSREDSQTIGNLDPPRPAAGVLSDAEPSSAPFGTTHELLGLHEVGEEKHNPYATLADAALSCPTTHRWLTRARTKQDDQYGQYWDSENLADAEPDQAGQGSPAAQFLHGLQLTGIAPITRANDPFWNIRAFDNALARHDGYRLSSFICALSQIVMDDITGSSTEMRSVFSNGGQ